MEDALRALLVGDVAVTALVGQRVYWGTIPQGSAAPSVAMYVITRLSSYTMQGSDGLEESRIQIDVRDTELARAWQVRDAIKSLISGYRGTVQGIALQGLFLVSERQRFESIGSESFHTVSMDVQVWSRIAN